MFGVVGFEGVDEGEQLYEVVGGRRCDGENVNFFLIHFSF